MKDVAILGGGASALMCACFAKQNVTIFEKADKCGKKILATGNGRCNLTNLNMNNCSYNQDISVFLNKFNQQQTLSFFNTIGLEVYSDTEGRVYPISNSATSVLSVLKNCINLKKNIKINAEKSVKDIIFSKNKYKLVFENNKFEYFDKVVIASGNKTELAIFNKFNIKSKPFKPSLCSLKTKPHKNLSGVRVDNVLVKCNDLNFKEIGEILFKDDGISGIVIFNLSAYMARQNDYCQKVSFDFLPNVEDAKLLQMLQARKAAFGDYLCDEFLTGMFHKVLNYEILKRCGISLNKKVADLTKTDLQKICSNIKNYEIKTTGYFENNQVASGGILLNELTNNLESKTNKGLYFIGEVCDVDGVCGGHNLQWAWTSGKIVGENL